MPALEPVGIDFLQRAAYVHSTDVDLPASREEIWNVLADNNSWHEWFDGCRSMRASSPIWSTRGDTRTIRVGALVLDETAVELEPHARWAMSITNSNLPLASRLLEVVALVDTSRNGEIRTEVRWTGAFDLPSYMRPLNGIIAGQLVKKWGISLECLFDAVTARR